MSLPLLLEAVDDQPERILVYRYENSVRGDLIGVFHADDLHVSAPTDVETLDRVLAAEGRAIVHVDLSKGYVDYDG